MNLTPQISFRNVPPSPSLISSIEDRLLRLEKFFPRIIACRVIVESPHQHHYKGNHYRVSIDLSVPGKELVVNRDPAADETHADAYIAIRDAFNAMTRQLQDFARERRGESKHHASESFEARA